MIGVIENIFTKVFSEKNLKTFEKIILVSATLGVYSSLDFNSIK